MITNELIAFIKEGLEKNVSREEISKILTANGGWSDEDIQEAFNALPALQTLQASQKETPPGGVPPVIAKLAHPEAARQFAPARGILPHEISTAGASSTPPPFVSSIQMANQAARTAAHLADNNPFFQTFAAKAKNEQETKAKTPLGTTKSGIMGMAGGGGRVGVAGTSTAQKEQTHRGWFSFFLFLVIVFVLLLGVAFSYFQGYFPQFFSPLLEKFNIPAQPALTSPARETSSSPQVVDGIALDHTSSPIAFPETPKTKENPENHYFPDRISLSLPPGTPVSVTTLASTLAGELKGRVERCIYMVGNNQCILALPVKDAAELKSILTELLGDSRIKGAEMVAWEQ